MRFGEWEGRSGGYAIQTLGSTLVERLEGSVSNVVGLPVGLLAELAPRLVRASLTSSRTLRCVCHHRALETGDHKWACSAG